MINICQEFAMEYGMEYNPLKSVCMVFTKGKMNIDPPQIELSGRMLRWVTQVKHLGNHISCDLSEDRDIQAKRGDLVGRVNTLLANCYGAPDNVLMEVFSSQCSHMYGAQTWNFKDKSVKSFHTMWRRCIRRLLDLPWQTHSRFLPDLTGLKSSEDKVMAMFVKCVKKMLGCDNKICNFIAHQGSRDADSIIGSNLRYISRMMNTSISEILQAPYLPRMTSILNDNDKCTVQAINELRSLSISGFGEEDIKTFVNFLCIS